MNKKELKKVICDRIDRGINIGDVIQLEMYINNDPYTTFLLDVIITK